MKNPSLLVTLSGGRGTSPRDKVDQIQQLLSSGHNISSIFHNFYYKSLPLSPELPPDYVPEDIGIVFNEAAQCLAINCFNAAGAMFRLCLDMATKNILELNDSLKPTQNDNKSIHNRLNWIFKNNILSHSLEDLSRCIKDDGNDAAHDGALGQVEAEDLLDFTKILLERVYTEPARIKIAKARRDGRRNKPVE